MRNVTTWLIQAWGMFRRELLSLIRQPKLILIMVLGPFAVLLLFGAGYRNDTISLRTIFVAEEIDEIRTLIESYEEEFDDYVEPVGYTSDVLDGRRALEAGEVDLVVVFPPTPLETIRAGSPAEIAVLHNKIDPIQQTAVVIAAEVATAKLNAAIVSEMIAAGQDQARSDRAALESGIEVTEGLAADEVIADEVEVEPAGTSSQLITIEDVQFFLEEGDPRLLAQPFVSDSETILRRPIDEVDFFVPSAIGLLLQHATVSLAALSLMRDRNLGLVEMYRVGPIRSGSILIGKYSAYLVVGLVVGLGLLGVTRYGLGTEVSGALAWAVASIVLGLFAGLSLGFVAALVARSDVQAVQFAMLVLLLGLFFGGFFLDLDNLRSPFRDIAWLLPVTFTIRLLQDVMLRGVAPDLRDVGGLVAQTAVYGLVAWRLLVRQLRVR